jgi:hypothetical protein
MLAKEHNLPVKEYLKELQKMQKQLDEENRQNAFRETEDKVTNVV